MTNYKSPLGLRNHKENRYTWLSTYYSSYSFKHKNYLNLSCTDLSYIDCIINESKN